jgi:hypothetical protein
LSSIIRLYDIYENIIVMEKKQIKEATGGGSSGSFKVPVVLAPQNWENEQLSPFVEPVYDYTNAELAYEEADGDFKETPAKRAAIERRTKKLSDVSKYLKQFYTGQNDEEGSAINPTMNGLPLKEEFLDEDLAVWFGTKKKPKGSKQPKGPWVNICRKENGKHPPCGRPEAKDKGYPKCRAVGVAAKMSASEKRSACQQKRRAEKTEPKTGTGNAPTMTHYKPKNEGIKSLIRKVLRENTNPTSSK